MYIVHDRMIDDYKAYSNLSKLARQEGIPYDTLMNHFTRHKRDRYTVPDARLVVKTELIVSKRKKRK